MMKSSLKMLLMLLVLLVGGAFLTNALLVVKRWGRVKNFRHRPTVLCAVQFAAVSAATGAIFEKCHSQPFELRVKTSMTS